MAPKRNEPAMKACSMFNVNNLRCSIGHLIHLLGLYKSLIFPAYNNKLLSGSLHALQGRIELTTSKKAANVSWNAPMTQLDSFSVIPSSELSIGIAENSEEVLNVSINWARQKITRST